VPDQTSGKTVKNPANSPLRFLLGWVINRDVTFNKNKTEIIKLYNRKRDLYTKASKVNLEITPLLTEIAKKRDQHFVDTQNCVGTTLTALGAAISMILDPPTEGVDEQS